MIGVCGHGVKPGDAPDRVSGPRLAPPRRRHGREYYWRVEKTVKRPGE